MELMRQAKQLVKRVYYQPPIQRAVIKLVSPIKPPPYATATMEFDYGLWLGISSLHCVDGRQLGEDNTWPYFFRERIPTEYHTSNMPGSRAGHAINMTTLHIVMKRWDSVLPLVAALRKAFDECMATDGQALTLGDLYLLSKTGVALPALMVRRHESRIRDGALPADVATQFKIIAGVFMVVQHMLWSGRHEANDRLDAEIFYDYADKHGIFISPSGYACGGSRRKIMELYDIVYQCPADSTAADTDQLAAHGDPAQLVDYAINTTALDLMLLGAQRELQRFYYTKLGELGADDTRDCCLRHIEEQLGVDGDAPDFKCRGIWPLFDRLDDARIAHPPNADSGAVIEQFGLVAEPDSTTAVIAHYQDCLQRIVETASERQARIARILGRRDSGAITPQRVARRLNVLPVSVASRAS